MGFGGRSSQGWVSTAADGIALYRECLKKKNKKNYDIPPCPGTHTRRIIPVLHGNLLHGHPSHWRREAACLCPSLAAGLPWCRQKPRLRRAAGPGSTGRPPPTPFFSENKRLILSEERQEGAQLRGKALPPGTHPALLMLLEMGGFKIKKNLSFN